MVIDKERKRCKSIEELVLNSTLKQKAKEFVKKYMASKGPVYQREANKNTSPGGGNDAQAVDDSEDRDNDNVNEDRDEEMDEDHGNDESVQDDSNSQLPEHSNENTRDGEDQDQDTADANGEETGETTHDSAMMNGSIEDEDEHSPLPPESMLIPF